jgi:hypothetical protein
MYGMILSQKVCVSPHFVIVLELLQTQVDSTIFVVVGTLDFFLTSIFCITCEELDPLKGNYCNVMISGPYIVLNLYLA